MSYCQHAYDDSYHVQLYGSYVQRYVLAILTAAISSWPTASSSSQSAAAAAAAAALQPASSRRRRAAVADQILVTNLSTLWGPVYLSWARPRSARLGSMYERQAAANSSLIAR